MVQKVSPPILHRKNQTSAMDVTAQLPAVKNRLPDTRMPAPSLPSGILSGSGIQLAESVLGVASELIRYAETRQQTQQVKAQCQRDIHLSDNEVKLAKVELKKLRATLQAELQNKQIEHQRITQAAFAAMRQLSSHYGLIQQCLDDYKSSRDPNQLALMAQLLNTLPNGPDRG